MGIINTRFFHVSTIIQRRINQIEGLQNDDGAWITEPDEIKALVVAFDKKLYTEENTDLQDITPSEYPSLWLTEARLVSFGNLLVPARFGML